MKQATGIALGRLAYDADFSIMQIPFDGDRSPVSPAVRHKLVNAPTVEDILDRFDELVEPDTKGGLRGFRLSLPISTSPEQWKAFREAMFIHGCVIDHCWGWIESQFPEQFELYYSFLFIDLTPGQVASCSRQKSRYWPSEPTMNGYTTLDDISSLSTRTVYDRLVKSIVPSSIQLDYIGILRPEGAFPEISATEIESMFPNGRVTWFPLDNIAHGTAVTMSKYFYDLPLNEIRPVPTISIMLANDKLVTVLRYQEDFSIPAKRIFTTSRDNRTTVTVRVYCDASPFDEVILHGLAPRPKDQARIKIIIDLPSDMDIVVTVEEIGTGQKTIRDPSTPWNWTLADSTWTREREHIEMTPVKDGLIGELPE